MECNREDALQALQMAEQKFLSGDLMASRKLALKAQAIFPGLEATARFMAVLDVHSASGRRLGGSDDMDWYEILQVHPDADVDTVKKQYRKLALLVHPDKNTSLGAESAFKLIVEALQVLSDKTKRTVFDIKRKSLKQNVECPDVAGRHHKRYQPQNFYQYSAANRAAPKSSLQPFTFWTACPLCQTRYQFLRRFENENLFCPRCRQPFIAKEISCSRWASSTEAPRRQVNGASPFTHCLNVADKQRHVRQDTKSADKKVNVENGKRASALAHNSSDNKEKLVQKSDSCHRQQADGPKEERFHDQERKVEDEDAVAKLSHENLEKNENKKLQEGVGGETIEDHQSEAIEGARQSNGLAASEEIVDVKKKRDKRLVVQRRISHNVKLKEKLEVGADDQETYPRCLADVIERVIQNALAGSVRQDPLAGSKEVHQTVDNKKRRGKLLVAQTCRSSNMAELVDREEKLEVGANDQDTYPSCLSRTKTDDVLNQSDDDFQGLPSAKKAKMNEIVTKRLADGSGKKISKLAGLAKRTKQRRLKLQKDGPETMAEPSATSFRSLNLRDKKLDAARKPKIPVPFSLPDADFHDFDYGREEGNVEAGQMWALYDDKEGMPKLYLKVKRVECRSPFRVVIGWCEPWKPSRKLRSQVLVSELSIACGEFRIGSNQVLSSVNSFSHIVKCEKESKGRIVIYPKRGDIWAIYSGYWEAGKTLTRTGNIMPGNCTVVEVLSDCTKASGISLLPLQKVQGFKALFAAPVLQEQVLRVPFSEMWRLFSNQVPAHKLKGDETPALPRQCWELDPAALPLNFV